MRTKPVNPRRSIPSVEKVLQSLRDCGLPRPAVAAIVRRELAAIRSEKKSFEFDVIVRRVCNSLDRLARQRIQPVINGTGILVHTNLGRSPLGSEVAKTLSETAKFYSNLEYDLDGGERGGRAAYLEHNLALLCGAEEATLVNNCAAALVLILRHFTSAKRPEVIISRGELIQIGGGFRIPEILEASGARLREVGTTNKTSLADYENAIHSETGLILKVHRSNFFMDGFVSSPPTESIAAVARKKRVPFVEDLGSGATISTEQFASIEHEPTPLETLKRGVDLVCCSGDKLFGGVQAGIIVGKSKLVRALKKEPFFRALRCDKLILSAMQTTVDLYLAGRASNEIPVVQMLSASNDNLAARAERLVSALAAVPVDAAVGVGDAQVGGGTLPRTIIPSVTIDLKPRDISLREFAGRLRSRSLAVIGYIAAGKLKIDLRTVFPEQDEEVSRAIEWAAESTRNKSSANSESREKPID